MWWTQMAYNRKIDGGFLPMLDWLIQLLTGNCLTSLGVEALSGLTSTGGQRLISNDLYVMNGGSMCHIETDGKVLYLEPTSGKGFETVGNGLYFMKQCGMFDGRGLILGPNSQFYNIPILVMILQYYFQEKIFYRLRNRNWWNSWQLRKYIYCLKIIDEIQKMLTTERINETKHSTEYNTGVSIIRVIDTCFGVTAIWLGITGIGLLSTIVVAPAVIGIEAISLLRDTWSCRKTRN